MKNIIKLTLISLLIFGFQLEAQNFDLPPKKGKNGKCYIKHFDYDKKLEWKEIDCLKLTTTANSETTEDKLIRCEQEKIKMKEYQEKLKTLGYEVDITGIADNKTIIAHHKYLKLRKKEEKRKLKAEKRKAKTI